jgi:uncharacterized coiled-coil protein SlyX
MYQKRSIPVKKSRLRAFKVIKAAWQEKIFRKINDLIVDISQLLRHTQARLEFFITIVRLGTSLTTSDYNRRPAVDRCQAVMNVTSIALL